MNISGPRRAGTSPGTDNRIRPLPSSCAGDSIAQRWPRTFDSIPVGEKRNTLVARVGTSLSLITTLLLAAIAAVALTVTPAGAADGDQLRQINAAYSRPCSINVGLAFDGTNLLIPCYDHNVIDVVSPVDGHLVGTITVQGRSSLGAAAWDSSRNKLWVCSDFFDVILVDPTDGSNIFMFTATDSCFDGLAYDGVDDTLWTSGDVHSTVYHYTSAGALIATHSVFGKIGSCGNSGIAVGGSTLYLANNGCSEIYALPKDFSSSSLFASFPARLEDLECDDVTFASQGVGAIWSIDAYDRVINAWEIPLGLCGFGGQPPDPNQPPVVTITDPADGSAPYAITSGVNLAADLTDPNAGDTHTCDIDWGDGSTTPGVVSEAGGAGTCVDSADHVYAAAGVYTITVTVTDDADPALSGTDSVTIVVYDPSAGFVTGGGWINSPEGAYTADPTLTGKANFGFVSKYKKGASVPEGVTQFMFSAGDFNFHSNVYQWLVVNQGGTNAQFKGEGTVNGAVDANGNAYKFMLWAGDGGKTGTADTFQIRIWWEDAGGEHVVYDNLSDQAIDGGSIVIHTKK